VNGRKVRPGSDFTGCVPFEAQKCVVPVHADSVVRDLNERDSTPASQHLDARCLRVDGIFDEFFNYCGWAFDYLTCCNLTCDVFGKKLNARHDLQTMH
jgi:hypothetical protein